MVNFSFGSIDEGTLNSAITQGGLPIIISLVAVALTERRMGRSRGRTSIVRMFAPVGTIGFLGVVKVHITSVLPIKLAAELGLHCYEYASASRIGSVRNMNVGGIDWTSRINFLQISVDEETPLKTIDDFKYENEDLVSYVSRRQRVEVIRQENVYKNNRERFQSAMVNTLFQAIFCFGITIGAEFAAGRQRETLAMFFCASVVLTELSTALIEWIYTTVSDPTDRVTISRRRNIMVSNLSIYEQKIRADISRVRLRKWQINRMVQIRLESFGSTTKDQWLLQRSKNRAYYSIYSERLRNVNPPDIEMEQLARLRQDQISFSLIKAFLVVFVYWISLMFAAIGIVAEIFTYSFYITASFSPNMSTRTPSEQDERDTLESFGKWFAVQLGAFLFKVFSPRLDKMIPLLRFSRPTDPEYNGGQYFDFSLGDRDEETCFDVLRGDVRAANSIGVLLQTMEHSVSIPPAWSTIIRLNNGTFTSVVVPQCLLISGSSILRRLDIMQQNQTHLNEERCRRISDYLLDISAIETDNIREEMQRALTWAFDTSRETQLRLRHEFQDDSSLIIIQFIPDGDSNINQTFYAEVAAIRKEDIKERVNYRMITRTIQDQTSTELVVWNGYRSASTFCDVEEASVLYFATSQVNDEINEKLLVRSTLSSSNHIPLPIETVNDLCTSRVKTNIPSVTHRGAPRELDFDRCIYHAYRNNVRQQRRQRQVLSQISNAPPLTISADTNQNVQEANNNPAGHLFKTLEQGNHELGITKIGKIFLPSCFIHRYPTVTTASGRLMEASKQVYGDLYRRHDGEFEGGSGKKLNLL